MTEPLSKLLLASPPPPQDPTTKDLAELLDALAKEDPLLGLAGSPPSGATSDEQSIGTGVLALMKKRLEG